MSDRQSRNGLYTQGRTIVAALDSGCDLQEELERLTVVHGMRFCRVSGLGSLAVSRITFYDQTEQRDVELAFDTPMMLVTLAGTVLNDSSEAESHCHLVLADREGTSFGGDLSPGCTVFSCEVMLTELDGPPVARRADSETGLDRLVFG